MPSPKHQQSWIAGPASVVLSHTRLQHKLYWPRLVCAVLVNSDILIANYGVKQNQFTKPSSEPRTSDPEESNEAFDFAIIGWLL